MLRSSWSIKRRKFIHWKACWIFKKSTIPNETIILSIHKNRMLMRQFYKNRVLMRAYYSSLAILSRITIRNQIIFKNLFSIRKRSRSMNNKFKSRIRSFRGRTKKYQSYRFFLISNGWKFKLLISNIRNLSKNSQKIKFFTLKDSPKTHIRTN